MSSRKTFTKSQIKDTFEKCKEHKPGANTQIRFDHKGRKMHWAFYGKRDSEYGWNIDHINRNPSDNNLNNLRAVNFKTHEELNKRFNTEKS